MYSTKIRNKSKTTFVNNLKYIKTYSINHSLKHSDRSEIYFYRRIIRLLLIMTNIYLHLNNYFNQSVLYV